MTPAERGSRGHLIQGSLLGLLAEGLAVPTGILVAAFLTRRLGPAGYGLYSLAAGLTFAFESAINALLSRTIIKFVSQSADWRPIARTVLRVHAALAGATCAALWLLAPAISEALHEPGLTPYLRLFALDLPVWSVGEANVHVLVGLGHFRTRAVARAAWWLARLAFTVLFVQAGLGIAGAIAGSIAGSACMLLVSVTSGRPLLWGGGTVPLRPLMAFGIPLFLTGITIAVSRRVDLFALKALGGDAAEAGLYAAAQNVALVPSLLGLSITPLLLSTLSRALHEGQRETATRVGRDFVRMALMTVPLAALAAGADRQIVMFLYGTGFAAAAPALGPLVFAGVAQLVSSVQSTLLIAADRPHQSLLVALPPLGLALALFPVLIPRRGLAGAALATMLGALLGVALGVIAVFRTWRTLPRLSTLGRVTLISGAAYYAGAAWPVGGVLLVLKLALLGLAVPAAFVGLGEIGRPEAMALLRALRPGATSATLPDSPTVA